MGQFRGKTQDAEAPFLSADFWEAGKSISGKVIRVFDTENGPSSVIKLVKAVEVGGEVESIVTMGNMAGFRMSLQAAGLETLMTGDSVHIECTGKTNTDKGSPRVDFEVEVNRPD